MDAVKRAKAAVRAAVEGMESALKELESASPDAREQAQTDFDTAAATHEGATRQLKNAEIVAEARGGLPVDVTDPGSEPGRLDDELGRGGEDDGIEVGDGSGVRVKRTPGPYYMGAPHAWTLDNLAAQRGSREAFERLQESYRQLHEVGKVSDYELRAIAETAGAGGELVAPLYLQEEYLKLARAARPYWDACTKRPLPPNANTINIPRLKTGTATAAQKDLAEVENVNLTTGLLTFPVITVAGDQDFARQLFDRAVPELADMVVFPDLVADYMTKVDVQALSGNGSAPNAKGVLETAEVNTQMKPHKITYTSGTFELQELYKKIAGGIAAIHESRYLPPTAIFMHPRRWGACLAAHDTQNRPLIVPAASGPFNVLGNLENVAPEAIVGHMQGLPVIVDPSIPTNLGSGTNQDIIIIQRNEDIWALEDEPIKMKVWEEVLSKELAIRCQVYNYLAFTSERYPQSISMIEGTGLTTPSF